MSQICLKRLESRTRSGTNVYVCSGTSEAFGAAWTLSDPTEHAKSEEEALDAQAQNVHAAVELAEHRSGVFKVGQEATEWLKSGRIRQLEVWVWVCGGLYRPTVCKLIKHVSCLILSTVNTDGLIFNKKQSRWSGV